MKKYYYNDTEPMELEIEDMYYNSNDSISVEEVGEYRLAQDGSSIKPPTKVAHCDCMGASHAMGVIFAHNYEPVRVLTMQPVTPKGDDTCPYCEHAVYYRSIERANKNYMSTYGRNKTKREPKPTLMAISNKRNKPVSLKKTVNKPNSQVVVLLKGVSK